MDRLAGAAVSAAQHNRKPHAATGDKEPDYTLEELLMWAVLERAVDDLAILSRYGLFRKDGSYKTWPTKYVMQWGKRFRIYLAIDHMRDPGECAALRHFFLGGSAQILCDWVGCRLPAEEIFWSTVKNHGATK